jgi:2-iminoacetate synthase ThiH
MTVPANTVAGARPADRRPPAARTEVARVVAKVEAAERVSGAEALLLHEHADLSTLGRLGDLVRERLHPERRVTYIVDRNVNPTNVCIKVWYIYDNVHDSI